MNILISDSQIAAVPIAECGERLVSILEVRGVRYGQSRLPENDLFHFVRKGIAERLGLAQQRLPSGVNLQLDEGLRPVWLQRKYFVRRLSKLRQLHPGLDDVGLRRMTNQFIADPDTVPPHATGGAIDVCLVDDAGKEIDVGSPPDVPADLCEGRCHTAATNLNPAALANRRLLIDAMVSAGFVNYFTEWWHWSWGDQYWAYFNGGIAHYGSAPEALADPAR